GRLGAQDDGSGERAGKCCRSSDEAAARNGSVGLLFHREALLQSPRARRYDSALPRTTINTHAHVVAGPTRAASRALCISCAVVRSRMIGGCVPSPLPPLSLLSFLRHRLRRSPTSSRARRRTIARLTPC